MTAIEAVLFDKDGTLFDFEATWRAAVTATLERLAPEPSAVPEMAAAGGFDMASGTFAAGSAFVAGSSREIAAVIARWRPDLGAAGVTATLRAMDAEIGALATPVPAVGDLDGLLGRIGATRLLGIATNDSRAGAERDLATAAVRHRFDHVLGFDSVARPKPAPDMILAFAEAAAVAPGAVAMVGDSRHDLEAARAAGCGLVVGVLTGPARHGDLAHLAHHVVDSIDALPALLGD